MRKIEPVQTALQKEEFLALLANSSQKSWTCCPLFPVTADRSVALLFPVGAVKSPVTLVSCAFAEVRKSSCLSAVPHKGFTPC